MAHKKEAAVHDAITLLDELRHKLKAPLQGEYVHRINRILAELQGQEPSASDTEEAPTVLTPPAKKR